VTFGGDATGATLGTQTQYVIANDGYVGAITETNGFAGGGMINYKVMPGTYRTSIGSLENQRTYGPAQTGLQPHATCQGVAALSNGANILAWQSSASRGVATSDPFFNYIPWQKSGSGRALTDTTSEGFLDDRPASWVDDVKTLTGVDLTTLNTAAEFKSACQGIGGTYYAADTMTNPASTSVTNAVTPLNAKIASLESSLSALNAAKATVDAALAAATGKVTTLTKLDLSAAAKSMPYAHAALLVSGEPNAKVVLSASVSAATRKALKLTSAVVATGSVKIDANGSVILELKPTVAAAKAIAKYKGTVAAVVTATSGAAKDTVAIRLTK
jgi:hypothetical protein